MSKKLSQAEIDALVASLMTGDAPVEEGASDETSGEESIADAKPEEGPAGAEAAKAESETPGSDAPAKPPTRAAEPVPVAQPAAAAPPPPVGLTPETMPFELIQDLGPITQPEVDAAIGAYHTLKAGPTAVRWSANPPASEPVAAEPVAPAAAAAMVAPPAVATPPSSADYTASQTQAAQQTRKALSMAAISSVLMDIELTVTVELGKARLSLGEVLALGPGSVITLDKQANTPVDVMVNRLPLMKAEVLAIAEKYGVRITQSSLNVKAAS